MSLAPTSLYKPDSLLRISSPSCESSLSSVTIRSLANGT
jgi:hypothetical protein